MDVPPFTLAAERNEIHALNLVGLRRAKISREAISELKKLFNSSTCPARPARSVGGGGRRVRDGGGAEFIEFVKKSPNGLCRGLSGRGPRAQGCRWDR